MKLSTLDTAIVCGYAVRIFVLAQWVSREKDSRQKNAQDYAVEMDLAGATLHGPRGPGVRGLPGPCRTRATFSYTV
jgi:hypothetical protein